MAAWSFKYLFQCFVLSFFCLRIRLNWPGLFKLLMGPAKTCVFGCEHNEALLEKLQSAEIHIGCTEIVDHIVKRIDDREDQQQLGEGRITRSSEASMHLLHGKSECEIKLLKQQQLTNIQDATIEELPPQIAHKTLYEPSVTTNSAEEFRTPHQPGAG